MSARATSRVEMTRIHALGSAVAGYDLLAAEEPLEIRLEGASFSVTLRTPGDDPALVAGYLFTEGVIDGPDDLAALAFLDVPGSPQGNTVGVRLASGVPTLRAVARTRYASSACGLCGKTALEQVFQRSPPLTRRLEPDPAVLLALPERMEAAQGVFARTGGLHAAALFTPEGELEVLREDIGRHNAVDKVLGWRVLADRLPVDDRILLVSGRIGFEIVQKALVARVPVVAAMGAPSSLAASLAAEAGQVLVGFLRDGRFNRYGAVLPA